MDHLKIFSASLTKLSLLFACVCLCTPAESVADSVSGHSMTDFQSIPINIIENDVKPKVVINSSNDNQLFFKAYNDYGDLDNDGIPETTYKHAFDYYGYFDSYKCYTYDTGDQRFEPVSVTTDKYCTGQWSGNFLNWASMSRVDTIRKILFGGKRRVDTSTGTVLERAYLPHDAHSWAKHYDGADLPELTPFVLGVDYDCDQGNLTGCDDGTGVDYKKTGITIGNTTDVDMGNYNNNYSENFEEPPLIKVVKGNYSLWASNERWQITWADGTDGHSAANSNDPDLSGIHCYDSSPALAEGIGEKNYVARIQVCVDGLREDNCKDYPGADSDITTDDVYKPTGLLQSYGDEELMEFAMVAGSYNKHASGGVLIKNMGSFTDEVNVDSDGTFPLVAEFAGGPSDNNQSEGIVNAWSLYRISGYDGDQGYYNSGDNCSWGLSDFSDVTADNACKNWGNPFAEIFYQSISYLADGGVIGPYRSNSSTGIPGLPVPQNFEDPIDDDEYCAPLYVINLNSSVISYDFDELDAQSYSPATIWDSDDLPGSGSTKDMTDFVGDAEGITGNEYFVGEVNIGQGTDDQLCTSKTVSSLGDTGGVCPEAPRLLGSYRIAGLAYYAHVKDIRPASANNRAMEGYQTVDTFSVAMAPAVPVVEIPDPSDTSTVIATILPACRNTSFDPEGNCAIVDFKILEQTIGADTVTGKVYINWEDSEQGGDYDQDMWGTIEYALDMTTNQLSITTSVHARSTPFAMGLGYVLSGTSNSDGFHAHSGINGYSNSDTADSGDDCTDTDGCNCRANYGACDIDGSSTKTYTLGTSNTQLLKDPLWYAAKYGGFIDKNDNNLPDLVEEWDSEINSTGESGADGIPDNYFYTSNPRELEASLKRVLDGLLERTSSGTAAAVVSSNVRGEGALYQAFYEPLKKDETQLKEARWIGTVQALWLDRFGYTREDCSPPPGYDPDNNLDGSGNRICPTPQSDWCDPDAANGGPNGKLDDYCIDQVVQTYYDELQKRVRVRVFESTGPDTYGASGNALLKEINELSYLWNGREKLYLNGLSDTAQKENRDYSNDLASTGRYIMTWIDRDYDGELDTDEYINFDSGMFSATTPVPHGFFDVATQNDAVNVVDYIRGFEISGTRNRTIKYSADDLDENVMRLGDIINSTPTVVGFPQEAFNLLYKDTSYTTFRQQYQNRRTMVYVGGNDGLLHAFNGGFYKVTGNTVEYSKTGTDCATGDDTAVPPVPPDSAVEHELGREMWAYAPGNLLSHLQWLMDPNYAESHVYFVDGKPRVFDANIFVDDADHPNGWGTVLVVGMNLGGGEMDVDTGSNGSNGNNGNDDLTMRSAYVIFDITNPEKAPALLGEIQIPDASFSTVYPAVIAFRDKGADTNCSSGTTACNKWYLVFGNGPNEIDTYDTDLNGKVYLFDLAQLTTSVGTALPTSTNDFPEYPTGTKCSVDSLSTNTNIIICDTETAATFMGTPMVVDWDLDFYADSVYFGLVGDSDADEGSLIRFALNNDVDPVDWSEPLTLFDTNQPILVQPVPGKDNLGNKWIFFGTGRYFTSDDRTSTATQSLYGIKDDETSVAIVKNNDLLNVTDVEVYSDRTVTENGGAMTGIATFGELVDYIDDTDTANRNYNKGWFLDLPPIVGIAGTAPATRNISRSTLLGGVLFSSVYQPSEDPCTGEGLSRLYGMYYKTGTAFPGPTVFGTRVVDVGGVEKDESKRYLDIGTGFATTPSLHSGSGSGEKGVSVFTQLSTGDVVRSSAETVQSIRTGRLSWRHE